MWKSAQEEIREIAWLALAVGSLSALGVVVAVASAVALSA